MKRIPRPLALVVAGLALFLSLGAWALSSPVGSSPDEDFHLASIWCGSGPRDGLCEPGADSRHWEVPKKAIDSTCYAFHPEVNASCQGPRFLDDGTPLAESTRHNAGSTQYPSGFYYWMSLLSDDNIAVSTIVIRLANAALFSVLMVGTWTLLPRRFRFTLAAGTALTAIPLTMFLIPSANPSSWSMISISIMFPALLGYLAEDGKRMFALGGIALLSAMMGVGARGDSAAYAVVGVCAALALSFRPDRRFYLRALLPAGLILLAAVAFLTAGQTSLAIGGMGETPATMSRRELVVANLLSMPSLWSGIYGLGWGLGWLDTSIHSVVWAAGLFCVLGVMFIALRWQGWRKLVAITGVGAAALLVPLYILVSSNVTVGYEVQPRYILPLLILFVATVVAPSERPDGTEREGVVISDAQLWTVAGLLSVANAVALYDNMHRYTGPGTLRLDGDVAWWWNAGPSPLATWLIGSAAFGASMLVFAVAHRRGGASASAASVEAKSSTPATGQVTSSDAPVPATA